MIGRSCAPWKLLFLSLFLEISFYDANSEWLLIWNSSPESEYQLHLIARVPGGNIPNWSRYIIFKPARMKLNVTWQASSLRQWLDTSNWISYIIYNWSVEESPRKNLSQPNSSSSQWYRHSSQTTEKSWCILLFWWKPRKTYARESILVILSFLSFLQKWLCFYLVLYIFNYLSFILSLMNDL